MKFVVIGAHLRRDDVEPLTVAIPIGDLFLSAIEIADEQPLGDRDLLLRVAAVRAKLLDVATFIAIRYGFAVAKASEAQAKCAPHLDRWRRLLEENRENVEMTLKVAASSPRPRPDRHDFTSGAEYLRALQKSMATVDADFRNAVEEAIKPLAIEHRWTHRDEKSVELAALVPRSNVDAIKAAGESLRATKVPFLLSGPWPLEAFADDYE